MKSVVTSLIAATLLCVVAGVAVAAPIGWTGPKNPEPEPRGPWEARIRYLDPHKGPGGVYYTYSFMTVTGATQAYCQQQVQSILAGGNATVVQDCTPV